MLVNLFKSIRILTVVGVLYASCLANCNSRVFADNDLVVTAACTEHCWSNLQQQLSVQWKLLVGGTSVDDNFVDVPDITNIATGMVLYHTCKNCRSAVCCA